MKRSLTGWFLLILLLLPALSAGATDLKPRKPKPSDKCPVCGMFVAKYPDFACQIIFKDGTAALFDGAKDLFKYYLNLATYSPKRRQGDIASIFVTSYYSLSPIDGRKAWYVTGSDVYGPMGRELIPFENEAEAREFKVDHKGNSILKFPEVTVGVMRGME
jgi:nitrous oxide reductase accessory protein NosL